MLPQFARCCFHSCFLQDLWSWTRWYLRAQGCTVGYPMSCDAQIDHSGWLEGRAQTEYSKWFVAIKGCLTCSLRGCRYIISVYWSSINVKKGFPETNRSCSSRELRDISKAGLEKGILWGQRWWVNWYHSQHLLSWVLREFMDQWTHKKSKGHFEGTILAPFTKHWKLTVLHHDNKMQRWAQCCWGMVGTCLQFALEMVQKAVSHWSLQQDIARN